MNVNDLDHAACKLAFETLGLVSFENALDADNVRQLRQDCLAWIDLCAEYQIRYGINVGGDGTAHQAVGRGDSIDRFLDRHLFHEALSIFFGGGPYALNACTPVGGLPDADIYIHRIHRDVGSFIPGYALRSNMLVMLDDFTEDNGATWVLPGSHHYPDKPDEEVFNRYSHQLLGKAGTVVLFNSYVWHRGGLNKTGENRTALTLSFGRPFLKPQLDYARMLGEEYGKGLSPLTRQVLGYNCRVPMNHEEWYRLPPERLYQADQG
ncbi:MAG: phytanoyl-CoA dioxygenase family protein [Halomonas sp.]|nr:phytanoyl-CoA dioxygenase family protein [Halomonas sp.]MCC5881579.1 phytanoyl-CoA dioxygenase family protein [Halomonas sp.]